MNAANFQLIIVVLIINYFPLYFRIRIVHDCKMVRNSQTTIKHGRGRRPNLASENSRDKKQCPVPGCNTLVRTDHLRNHWNSLVLYEKNGKPADLSKDGDTCVTKKVSKNTLYFLKRMVTVNKILHQ